MATVIIQSCPSRTLERVIENIYASRETRTADPPRTVISHTVYRSAVSETVTTVNSLFPSTSSVNPIYISDELYIA